MSNNNTYVICRAKELQPGDEIMYGEHTAEVDFTKVDGDIVYLDLKTPFGPDTVDLPVLETVKKKVYG